MNRITHDLKTGETKSIPYTAEEESAHAQKIANAPPPEPPRRDKADRLADALIKKGIINESDYKL